MTSLEAGDVFSAEVTTVLRSGTAAVQHKRKTISIGPVTCDKGTLVHVKYLGERVVGNSEMNLGLCLTEHVVSEDYHEYIENIVSDLIPDEPPAAGEITYTKVDEIEGRDIGVTILGGNRICLGPVRAQVGDLVQISGVNNSTAEVLTESAKGDQYEVRFNILSGHTDRLPISAGEEYSTLITDIEGETPVAQLMNVPIVFLGGEASVGQKVDVRVTGFEKDRAVGEIVETYDEVGAVEKLGHWARMQWLRKAGFGKDPFRNFASEFLGVDHSALPTEEEALRTAIIADAIRLCLEEKAVHSDEEYPRAHITGIRHWVIHKLSTVLGEPDEDDDWFQDVLTEGKGQTLTFLGDVLKLSNGYYARGPTRVIMVSDTEAILVSGRPTSHFLASGIDLEFQGVSRRLRNTSESDLKEAGFTVQPLSNYLDTGGIKIPDAEHLTDFIHTRQIQEWTPENDWEAYTGNRGYGFKWGDTPFRVETSDGPILSLWRVPVEYSADEYQLKIEAQSEDEHAKMVRVPRRYQKQVCLALDAISGLPREIELSPAGDEIRLSCSFVPPSSQMRWLNAIGAKWEEPRNNQLHWRVNSGDSESIKQAFSELAVEFKNRTGELTH